MIWGQAHADRYNHTQVRTAAADWKRGWELEGMREPEVDEVKLSNQSAAQMPRCQGTPTQTSALHRPRDPGHIDTDLRTQGTLTQTSALHRLQDPGHTGHRLLPFTDLRTQAFAEEACCSHVLGKD